MGLTLAAGQSNIVGAAEGGPNPNTVSSLVTVWDNNNTTDADGSAFIAVPAWGNAPFATAGNYNNLVVHHCDRKVKEIGDPEQAMLIGKAGQAISYFNPSGGAGYARIASNWAIANPGLADTFLWHQGEQDAILGTAEATYKAAFVAMIAALVSDDILAADAKIIVGGLATTYAAYNTVLQNLCSENGYAYASPTGLASDGVHFTGSGLFQFGRSRYFRAWASLHGPIRKRGNPMALLGF
jgi:hypothetical protein